VSRQRFWKVADSLLRRVGLMRRSREVWEFSYCSTDGHIRVMMRNGYRIVGYVHPTPNGPLGKIELPPNPIFDGRTPSLALQRHGLIR
jgi:hypothetical protein